MVASLSAALPTWRLPRAPSRPPRRSWKAVGGVVLASLLFWVVLLMGTMMRTDVALTVDGQPASLSALKLAACASCALRPDRLLHSTLQLPSEPQTTLARRSRSHGVSRLRARVEQCCARAPSTSACIATWRPR